LTFDITEPIDQTTAQANSLSKWLSSVVGDPIRLTFTTSSEPEFVSWILSFREEAKVLRPKWLVDTVKQSLDATSRLYA
jgi:predicted DNA-binding transcriptional regulator YafY